MNRRIEETENGPFEEIFYIIPDFYKGGGGGGTHELNT